MSEGLNNAKAAFEKALVAACGEFPPVAKNRTAKIHSKKTGQTHSYKYADLSDIRTAINPVMSKHGLRWRQKVVQSELLTIVAHISGYEEITESPLFPTMSDGPQALGSAITYSRRYGLQLALGIVTEEDDDGQAAEVRNNEPKRTQPQQSRDEFSIPDLSIPTGFDPSQYVVKFGKHRNKKLAAIGPKDVQSYMNWMRDPKNNKDGGGMTPEAKEFLEYGEKFLAQANAH